MSVKRAQKEIDSSEFSEWQGLGMIEPLGNLRDDWRSAQICKSIWDVFTDADRDLEDFMLLEKREQTVEEFRSELKRFVK